MSCSGCPVQDVFIWMSCSVLNVLLWLSSPFCPVCLIPTVLCWQLAALCWQPSPDSHVLVVLFRQSCPGVLLCLSCSAYPVRPVLFCLSLLSVQFCLSRSACPVLPVMFCLSCFACSVLPVPFSFHFLVFLSLRPCPGCLIPAVMSSQPCPGRPV